VRNLSPEPNGSGCLKVQGDEAARLPDHELHEDPRGAGATVRGGNPSPVFRERDKQMKSGKCKSVLSNESNF